MQYNYFMKLECEFVCVIFTANLAAATRPAFGAGLLSHVFLEPVMA